MGKISQMTGGRAVRSVLITLAAAAFGCAAQAQSPGDVAKPAPPPAQESADRPPPIAFFIAKGEADACGPGCAEWIAADGMIDGAAPQRLHALLARAGKRKLPIYFHSPGGSVVGAMAIGRLMRARGMTAGVGRTIPQGCDATKLRDQSCDAVKRSGRELSAELRTTRTMCNSSCVYALIGASVREVAAGTSLGIHSIAIVRTDRNGRRKKESAPSRDDAEKIRLVTRLVANYVAAMGVSRALVDVAAAIPHDKVHAVTRDEIARFGIDRREFHESRWMADDETPGRFGVFKYIVEAKPAEPKQYRTTLIRLGCTVPKQVLVQLGRELGSSEKPASVAVAAPGSSVALSLSGKPKVGDNGIEIELRVARARLAFFEEAAAKGELELVELDIMSNAPAHRVKLSTAGLAPAIGAMAQRCP